MSNQRRTNVDVEVLALSETVRTFMLRTLEEHRDARTGVILIVDVAASAADVFELHHDDGLAARGLLDVAAQVVALDLASSRARS